MSMEFQDTEVHIIKDALMSYINRQIWYSDHPDVMAESKHIFERKSGEAFSIVSKINRQINVTVMPKEEKNDGEN